MEDFWCSDAGAKANGSQPPSSCGPAKAQRGQIAGMWRLLSGPYRLCAVRTMLPMQPGDVPATFADVDSLVRDVGFRPDTSLEEGIRRFADWYREYYRV